MSPALKTIAFCQQGLMLEKEQMTLTRTQRRMYDQSFTEAYRPIWSPGPFELTLKYLQPQALETAVLTDDRR